MDSELQLANSITLSSPLIGIFSALGCACRARECFVTQTAEVRVAGSCIRYDRTRVVQRSITYTE